MYKVNDSTIGFTINQQVKSIIIPGRGTFVDSIYRKNGQDSIFYRIAGVERAIKDSSGTVTVLTNIGSGYRWVATPSGDIKTVANSNTITWDSTSNANSLTAKADTSVLATQYDITQAPGGNTQIIFNDNGVYNGDPGLVYDKTTNKVTTDTTLLKRVRFLSDSGNVYQDIVFTPEEASATDSALDFTINYSAARVNPLSTRPNWVWSAGLNMGLKYPTDGYMRIGMESHYGQFGTYNWEFHCPEIMLPNGNAMRPASLLFPKNNSPNSQWLYEASIYQFDNSLKLLNYGSLEQHRTVWTNYVDSLGSAGDFWFETKTPTGVPVGGFKMQSQYSGTTEMNNWTINGKHWKVTTPAGLWLHATGAVANGGAGRSIIMNIPSSNSGDILWVGKDWGSSYTQAFQVNNSTNTVFGPVNETDYGYKLQVVASTDNGFYSRVNNADSSGVSYPVVIDHGLSTPGFSTKSGFGVGIKFKSENNQNVTTDIGAIEASYVDTLDDSEDADIVFKPVRAGALTEGFRIKNTGAVRFNNAFTFPTADGTIGQVLQTDGSGVVSWQTPSILVLKGTTNWTPGVVAAGSSASTTVSVTGAVVGDPVTVSKKSGYSNGEVYDAFVSATNTVTIRVHNVSTGSANYSSAADYNVVVLKY
jgi:hypothetical protein